MIVRLTVLAGLLSGGSTAAALTSVLAGTALLVVAGIVGVAVAVLVHLLLSNVLG